MKRSLRYALPLILLAVPFTLFSASCAEESSSEPDEEEVADASDALTATEEGGNVNTKQGYATRLRAAVHLALPNAKAYKLAQLTSARMPQSPFAAPLTQSYVPTQTLPFSIQAGNADTLCGDIGGAGTQMDAIGHFAYVDESLGYRYYGGLGQADVKPAPDSPLLRLGIEKYEPIVTSAILLDARKWNGGVPLDAGQLITPSVVESMLQQQHVRPLVKGDALLIYTGWSDKWADDNANPSQTEYYSAGPGLSADMPAYLASKDVIFVALDNPFTDAVNVGELQGLAYPPDGYEMNEPFPNHGRNLAQFGIAQGQNFNLKKLAEDKVYLSAFFLTPLQIRGGAGSSVTPVAVGAPYQW